ncbi:hypothetical protein D3C81_2288930 [compost metagenome]
MINFEAAGCQPQISKKLQYALQLIQLMDGFPWMDIEAVIPLMVTFQPDGIHSGLGRSPYIIYRVIPNK